MEKILDLYYSNNAQKLHILVDKILFKLRFTDVDNEDFYSLANEIFVDVLKRYDGEQDFNGFLYSCLVNKFKTEMTRRNRQKRQADRMAVSLDTPIGEEDGGTLADMIASNPGFKSRIQFELDFPNYSREELGQITSLMLTKRKYTMTDSAMSKVLDITDVKRKDPNFANAREIRNILA